jgi:hypothetical protein
MIAVRDDFVAALLAMTSIFIIANRRNFRPPSARMEA